MRGLFTFLFLVGCKGGSAVEVCTTDDFWTGGDEESPLMHPGADCVACHERENEGPTYAVAGTVYTAYDEVDDCNGSPDVVVEIVDANGDVTALTTNAAGNFFLTEGQSTLVFPITARVVTADGVREMLTPQTSGACNTCHTEQGDQLAPGRIVVP
jgi:cytochrome c553